MSSKYLGTPFDIHGGGEDLVFPHHENEIAQAEALTGARFVRYWLHNGFITLKKEKMSKSLGNVSALRDVLRRHTGSALRFFFLGTHYRSPIEFSAKRLAEAAAGLDRIYNCLETVDRRLSVPEGGSSDAHCEESDIARRAGEARDELCRQMDDDFNTAGALGAVFELVSGMNSAMERGREGAGLGEAATVLRELLGVLGLPPERETPPSGALEEELIAVAVWARSKARREKLYDFADEIRARLGALGVEIEDMPGGESRVVRRASSGGLDFE
jgi:cysteinyl-tRNA synthetase